jgi:hypothetical protein
MQHNKQHFDDYFLRLLSFFFANYLHSLQIKKYDKHVTELLGSTWNFLSAVSLHDLLKASDYINYQKMEE